MNAPSYLRRDVHGNVIPRMEDVDWIAEQIENRRTAAENARLLAKVLVVGMVLAKVSPHATECSNQFDQIIASLTEAAAEEAADFAESEIVQRAALRGSDPT